MHAAGRDRQTKGPERSLGEMKKPAARRELFHVLPPRIRSLLDDRLLHATTIQHLLYSCILHAPDRVTGWLILGFSWSEITRPILTEINRRASSFVTLFELPSGPHQ